MIFDMLDKPCVENCGGRYEKDASLFDVDETILKCNKCGHEIQRYIESKNVIPKD